MSQADVVRVLVLCDTDSYVKWGAALGDRFPDDWRVDLVVARSTAAPSASQLADALAGTAAAGSTPDVVGLADLRRRLQSERPDVLVLSARGWTVQAATSVVDNVPGRPVIVTGLPGVGVPVLPYGLGFRRAADVFVVHSRRELREFRHASRRLELPDRFELGHLPYLGRSTLDEPVPPRADGPVVFAAQALVPASAAERTHLVSRLADAARAHPDREVVVKVRAHRGEAQTHHEQVPLEDLVESLDDRPANLVVRTGPMHEHLERAGAFVTVSSTALLEAVACGVPAVALDDFGVGVEQINLALQGSGLLGSLDDVVAGRFAHADPAWCVDNYFHDPSEDTWVERVRGLVEQRRSDGLPAYPELPGSWRDGFRRILYRHFAFTDGTERTTLLATVEHRVAGAALWLTQRRGRLLRLVRPDVRGGAAQTFAAENSATAPQAEDVRTPTS
ncbi:DUF6716 putative glycosyltransferase [Aeromicrobium sp. REDSEA-S32_B7]|uniref:DUF6716 putative glycosyltransferase n=1 Tax=Aeromicrobium sp. REDSEA-S32_B7 TaxID=1811526 RepID=UPI000A59D931|nr:DUF6716 putative glycosyltransferase [Aeromicrobium sp. REDSEA-S32_B7]